MKKILISFILVLFAISVCGCTVSSGVSLNMTENNSSHQMTASYSKYSGYKKTFITVKSGKTKKVNVSVVTKKGDISLKITNDDGKLIYQGDKMSTSDFVVNLDEAGKYTVKVEAKKHSGSFDINWN